MSAGASLVIMGTNGKVRVVTAPGEIVAVR
jgi:hypothetical protein